MYVKRPDGEDFLHLSLKMCLLSRTFGRIFSNFYVKQIHKQTLVCVCWCLLCIDCCDFDYTNWQQYKVNSNIYTAFFLIFLLLLIFNRCFWDSCGTVSMNIIFNIVHHDGFLRISELGSRSNSETCLKEWRRPK